MFWFVNLWRTRDQSVPDIISAQDKCVLFLFQVMILHPEFIKYVYVNWTESHGRYPSTGFLTLIFALHICDEVKQKKTSFLMKLCVLWFQCDIGFVECSEDFTSSLYKNKSLRLHCKYELNLDVSLLDQWRWSISLETTGYSTQNTFSHNSTVT